MLDAYPSTSNWYVGVSSRDSYQRAVADDFSFELLEKLKTIGAEAWPIIRQQFLGPNT